MALADILSALQRDGEAEVARVMAERDQTVSAIASEAREQAKDAEAAAAISLDADLAAEAEVIVHRAVLHVERRLREAREAIFQEILGRVQDRLSRYRDDPAYAEALDALVAECLAFLGEAEVVRTDPRDVDLVRAALRRQGAKAEVEPSLDAWGGIVACDGDGALVRNTLEERLDRAEVELRRQIGDQVPGLRGVTEQKESR